MIDHSNEHIVSKNFDELTVLGLTVLYISISSVKVWHEFGVVPELPLKVLIFADIFKAHQYKL